MAGYPPYTPPPNSPYGQQGWPPDPRQQDRFAREQMKAQVRAQKAAFRAQRQAYRNQARALRRSSVLGPLLIVGIGVVLLLVRLGKIPFYEFESFYGRWWPLLFVFAGLILVAEWAFDHHSTQEGVPFVRRGVGGGVIFLLILLALTGACIRSFHDGEGVLVHGFSINPDNVGEVFGERHEYEQQIDQDFPAGTVLNIDNPHGDVTISGKSIDDKIHIVVNKQVYSWDEHDASNRADQLSPRVNLSGGTLTVALPQLNSASTDLAITLPGSGRPTGETTIMANHGDVNVSDLAAPLSITSNHGDIEIDRLSGPVNIHVSNNGSSFSAHGIQGDVTLRGHADDLNLTDISGAVSLEGEFYGDTHLERLAGPFSFRTGRTQFSVAKLDGMIDISNSEELTGSQIVGPVDLRTRSRNISFERVAGNVDITNSNGTVDLSSAPPLGTVSVENSNGAVTVTLPDNTGQPHAGVVVQTETKDGAIQDDLDNSHVDDTAHATHSTTIGDGAAHLTLRTTHADITIHKGLVEPPVPPAPTTVVAPQKAGKYTIEDAPGSSI